MAHLIEDDRFQRELFFTMEGTVKGGTLEKLVERLTHHSKFGLNFLFSLKKTCPCQFPQVNIFLDEEMLYAFLMTYRSFTESNAFLTLLMKR